MILAQSPYEALLAGLMPAGARVVVEIHGDWRTATRLYGSPLRRLLSPLTDSLGRLGLRRAAAVRTLSPYTSGLVRAAGVEPAAEFEAFVDLDAFVDRPAQPVPEAAEAVFVGVLERYKNVEGLAAAWRRVASRVPDARLHLIGTGTLTEVAESLEREGCTWDRRLEPPAVAAAIDGARALFCPRPPRGCRGSRSRPSSAAAPSSARGRAGFRTSSRTASAACSSRRGTRRASLPRSSGSSPITSSPPGSARRPGRRRRNGHDPGGSTRAASVPSSTRRSPDERRLIFATQVVDPDDPVLGATVAKLRALAGRVDELVVLADRAREGVLPSNCRVLVFGAGSTGARARLFLSALERELSPRPLAFVAHMVPRYVLLAAPLARPRRVPVLLWFTHWKASRTLVVAERLSNAILTVEERSFPIRSGKVAAIGHGIDTEAFAYSERPASSPLRAISLGRTSPAKGYETIAYAARLAGVEFEVRGTSGTAEERAERDRLRALGVSVLDPVPYAEVPALLAERDVLVNNMREGALDKIVYEAAATGMPVLASNSGFDDLLPPELRFAREDAAGLADRLRNLAGVDRNALGLELRGVVEARHSTGHWADGLLKVAENRGRVLHSRI